MCGIVGAYDVGAVDDRCLAAMSEAIAHRGPDAVGAWRGPGDPPRVRLGHRRLSIIDLSDAANQPFVKDGLALVFCGEIYNYRELKAELRAGGTSFRTDSDTEVLLEAWRRWGPGSLRRLRGMFAFALFDECQGTLTVANYADTRLFLTGLNLAYTRPGQHGRLDRGPRPLCRQRGGRGRLRHPRQRQDRRPRAQGDPEACRRCVALPDEIAFRPKGLFSAQLRAWIRRYSSDMVEDLVAGGTLVPFALVDKQMVVTMIDDDRGGAADRSKEIGQQLLTLEVWYPRQGRD